MLVTVDDVTETTQPTPAVYPVLREFRESGVGRRARGQRSNRDAGIWARPGARRFRLITLFIAGQVWKWITKGSRSSAVLDSRRFRSNGFGAGQ